MNYKPVFKNLGMLMFLLSCSMVFCLGLALWEYLDSDNRRMLETVQALSASMLIGFAVSGLLILAGRNAQKKIDLREAMLLVTVSWLLGALISSLPFFIWARMLPPVLQNGVDFFHFSNCFFEAMSGLTTTGASVLTNIELLPRPILLWRTFMEWLGGLGIVVLFVAVFPMVGKARIFRAETSGLSPDGSSPRLQETAQILWLIYLGLTVVQTLIMKWFDPDLTWFAAINFAMTTASSAGFAVYNASAGALSPVNQWIVILFMFIAGVNYGLYYQVIKGRSRRLFRDKEFRWYSAIMVIASLMVIMSMLHRPYLDMFGQHAGSVLSNGQSNPLGGELESIFRHSMFQVVSIQTTTGLSNADSDGWPMLPKVILLVVMLIGGCGGSTSGGIKVIRIVTTVKLLFHELERIYRPSVVRPIVAGNNALDHQQKQGILIYVVAVFAIMIVSTIILLILEDSEKLTGFTAISAIIATVNNIGPGFGRVGVTANYAWMADSTKYFLSLLMLIGRLEVFTVLVIFLPGFWRRN